MFNLYIYNTWFYRLIVFSQGYIFYVFPRNIIFFLIFFYIKVNTEHTLYEWPLFLQIVIREKNEGAKKNKII